MRFLLKTLVFLLASAALSKCASRGYYFPKSHSASQRFTLFETHQAPSTFVRLSSPPPKHHNLDLRIGLKTRLEDVIEELLEKISDPFHPSYRNYLTDVQSYELAKPEDEAIFAVTEWLKNHGFEQDSLKWSRMKDWVTVLNVPLPKVEKMLDTSYSIFRHQDGEHIVRTEKFSLPHHLHKHIDVVQPTTMFGRLNRQRTSAALVNHLTEERASSLVEPGSLSSCTNASSVTNHCLRQLYKTLDYQVKWAQKGNRIGVTSYLGEVANFADSQMFLQTQRPDQVGQEFEVVTVNGGINLQTIDAAGVAHGQGIEGNLDSQTVLGFTSPTPSIFYQVGGNPAFVPDSFEPVNLNEPYLAWVEYILALNNSEIPQALRAAFKLMRRPIASLAVSDGDNEQTVPFSYARKVCRAFAQLGARGVSVIFSSGDYGVGPSGYCKSNDGKQAVLSEFSVEDSMAFLASQADTLPYEKSVTSVGATENFSPEVAVSEEGPGGFTSGGGFSNYFATPNWQKGDVSGYLSSLGKTHQGLYNTKGRGYPDVSAQGAKYVIAWQGMYLRGQLFSYKPLFFEPLGFVLTEFELEVSGTSAAAPTFASVISLLNDDSLSRGGQSLGYLNPWLYSQGRNGLNDIVSGSSSGCNTTGFAAGKGWDPVTGLGTPDFKKLQLVTSTGARLPPAVVNSKPTPGTLKSAFTNFQPGPAAFRRLPKAFWKGAGRWKYYKKYYQKFIPWKFP